MNEVEIFLDSVVFYIKFYLEKPRTICLYTWVFHILESSRKCHTRLRFTRPKLRTGPPHIFLAAHLFCRTLSPASTQLTLI